MSRQTVSPASKVRPCGQETGPTSTCTAPSDRVITIQRISGAERVIIGCRACVGTLAQVEITERVGQWITVMPWHPDVVMAD